MKTRHTPGPWLVGPFDDIWPASDIGMVNGQWREKIPNPRIIAGHSSLIEDKEVRRANLQLMAASPEMLDALQAACEFIKATDPKSSILRDVQCAISRAIGPA